MDEKRLREELKRIQDASARPEIVKIYRDLILKFNDYQEQKLAEIRGQVLDSMKGGDGDYGVEMFVCNPAEADWYEDAYEPLLSTGIVMKEWGEGALETVFLEADSEYLEQHTGRGFIYKAEVKTNYESYPVTVTLRKNRGGRKRAEHLNRLLLQNGIKQAPVNEAYLNKFYDVVLEETKDRLREDERVEEVRLLAGGLDGCLKRERVLLWNVRQVQIKEHTFPVPVGAEVKFRHELLLEHPENGYLLDLREEDLLQRYRKGNILFVTTAQKQYQVWDLYEIMQGPQGTGKEQRLGRMTNKRVDSQSVFDCLERKGGAVYTLLELYRMAAGYEAAELFREIRVLPGSGRKNVELLFFPEQEGYYLNRDAMQFLIKALSEEYRGCRITGRLEQNEE